MRYIVISLIFLNVLLLFWHRAPEQAPVPAVKTPSRTEIELLDEAAAASEAELAEIGPSPAAETMLQSTDDNISSTPKEAESIAVATVVDAPVSVAQIPTAAPTVGSCRVSPWTAQAKEGEYWHSLLPAAAIWRIEERSVDLAPSYLVYIPAKATREESMARLRELKTLSLESAFLNQGEQMGGISLGLFSKPESAAKRLQQLRGQGIMDAESLERRKNRQEWRFHASSTLWPEVMQEWSEDKCDDQGTQNVAVGELAQ